MSNDWYKLKLGEVADIKLSNVDKKTNPYERSIRLCNYTDVYKNSFINKYKANNFMVASCNENEYEKFLLKKGQVAITKDSETPDDIGISTYIDDDFVDVVLGYHLSLITPNEDKLNGKFLHYWLNTKHSKTYFENNAGGSGQRCTLPIEIIKSIPINLPSISVQQQIAQTLSALDEKVELNKRIISKLEDVARLFFNYWFVQFDFPNEKGKPYKSSGGKMIWSNELKRNIPDGWMVKRLEEVVKVSNIQLNPAEFPNTSFKYYSIPVFDEKGTFCNEFGEKIKSNKFTVEFTDVLVSKLNPWFNRVIYSIDEAYQICSTEFVVWRTNSVELKNYLYMVARDNSFITYCVQSSTGTSHSHRRVNPQVMMKYKIAFDDFTIKAFGMHVSPILNMLSDARAENQKLVMLRDWILPKLMNGQIKLV